MRIAGGIIAFVLALIILVQSLAAGTANALGEAANEGHDGGGTAGFFVALAFVFGGAFLLGSVWTVALVSFALASLIGIIAGATTIFNDLIVWGIVALIYVAGCWKGRTQAKGPLPLEAQGGP